MVFLTQVVAENGPAIPVFLPPCLSSSLELEAPWVNLFLPGAKHGRIFWRALRARFSAAYKPLMGTPWLFGLCSLHPDILPVFLPAVRPLSAHFLVPVKLSPAQISVLSLGELERAAHEEQLAVVLCLVVPLLVQGLLNILLS